MPGSVASRPWVLVATILAAALAALVVLAGWATLWPEPSDFSRDPT